MNDKHEQRLARVLVELADTLVDDFDVLEFLSMLVQRCVELLNVTAAGVVLSDQKGGLRMAAASSEQAWLVELFGVQTDDGPCLDCVHSGELRSSQDLTEETARWPQFAPAAVAAGFRTAYAVPMRLRRTVIGALSLLDTEPDGVDVNSARLGQALADVATIGLLQHRTIDDNTLLIEQLQTALNSRVVIEQAKGVLSSHGDVDMDRAFGALRDFARSHRLLLSEVARSVAEGTIDLAAILAPRRASKPSTD